MSESSVERGEVAKTSRGEATRQKILECALELFQEQGYDGTTMRAIAERAGVSLGNAYYYFRAKEDLVQGFYQRMHVRHAESCVGVLQQNRSFKSRLTKVMLARQSTAQPVHRFAGELFKTASDPNSPLNPFSEESRGTREDSIAIFREVVVGAKERFPKDLEEALPELLWFLQMSMVLYWVHDRSKDCEKSEKLIVRSADLVSKFVGVVRLAPMKPLRSLILRTYREFCE